MHGAYIKKAKILFDIYIYFPMSNKSKGSALSLRSQFIAHFFFSASQPIVGLYSQPLSGL